MEYRLLGWPPEGPTVDLDHRTFTYAGKFVMPDTGKAIVHRASPESPPEQAVIAVASFSPDRVDGERLWIRYVDVHADRRGEGIGAHLCRYVVERARDRGFETVRIAVNNPYAYHALYKAGFGFTGEEAGLAEVILSTDAPRSTSRYQAGLDRFRERDLPDPVERFLAAKAETGPPAVPDHPDA